jgi:hypothetical protein
MINAKLGHDAELALLTMELQSVANAIRGLNMSLKESADALERIVKKLTVDEPKLNDESKLIRCELCMQPGVWDGTHWVHKDSTPRHRLKLKEGLTND